MGHHSGMSASGEGWFADPQDKRQLRWWNGTAWTEHTHPLTGPGEFVPSLPRWWSGFSWVLQVALLANVMTSAFVLYVDVETLAFVDDVRIRPDAVSMADAERIDALTVWALVDVAAYLVTAVMVIVWLYTLHHSSRMDRRVLRHSSGWAIGGWMVPVLNLWRPFQMVSDVRRGATGDADAPVPLRQGWWWGTWLALMVVVIGVNALYSRADAAQDGLPYAEALGAAASWERLSCVLTMVSAALLATVVREIHAVVRQPATAAG
jgi:hypothetical protein